MAKQFSILATDVDLRALDAVLRRAGDTQIFSDEPSEDDKSLAPLNELPIPIEMAGKVSLLAYLGPIGPLENVAIERVSPVKIHVETGPGHLIEFMRPFYNGEIIKMGRCFFETRFYKDRAMHAKDPEFIRWADRVTARIRKALPYQKAVDARVGPDAAERIFAGRLPVKQGDTTLYPR
ncbi:MAG TPA: hypothetical protein VGJ75_02500 [Dongiaceae bacterium]|jgi:hypothetical protein